MSEVVVTKQPTKKAPQMEKKKKKKKKKNGGKKKKQVPVVLQMMEEDKDLKKKNQGNCMQRFASSFQVGECLKLIHYILVYWANYLVHPLSLTFSQLSFLISNFNIIFQATVIGGIERGFKAYGQFVGRHHWKVVLASLVFGILCSSLFVFMYEEEDDGIKLWLPSGSDFKTHSILLNEEFGDEEKTRTASLLVVAKDGGNVLTADNMRRIYQLRKEVAEVISSNDTSNMFKDRCDLQLRVTEGVAGLDPDASFPDEVCPALAEEAKADEESSDKVCTENHVFEIWASEGSFDTTEELMKDLTDEQVLEAINTVDISGLTSDDFSASSYLGVNDASKDDDGNILKAQAMILNFVLTGYDTEVKEDDLSEADKKLKEAVMAWEAYFLDHFRDGPEDDKENFKDIDGVLKVYPKAQRSSKDINDASIANDQNLFFVGYLLVTLYIMIMLGKFNSVEQRIWLSLGGITAVILGIGTAYGLCSLFGIWGSQMNMIMPFMLLGIGIDDMFVIVQNFDTLDDEEKWKPRAERMGLAMKHGGVAITITTVTDLLAFGIGASTVLPALSHFCIYATFGIFFVYFYMITFFFGLFCLDVIRSEDTRDACICCWQKPDWKPNEFSQKSYLTQAFTFYSRTLLKLPCRYKKYFFQIILVITKFNLLSGLVHWY